MQQLEQLYTQAAFIRAFELAIGRAADAGHVPGLAHLCCGAELAEVAICAELCGSTDQVTGSHRSHGLALAMGADPIAVAAEIFGRSGGLSDGRGGTQHLIAPEVGFLTSNGIVGAQVPLAAGAALTAKTKDSGGVGVAFFGDGAANQGAVFETMNLAVALKLPMLFILENNGVGQTTASGYATGNTDLLARAAAFGLKTYKMDGYNGVNCINVASEAVAVARMGAAVFIEAVVPRLSGHYHGETGVSPSESERDPLQILAASLPSGVVEAFKKNADDGAETAIAAALAMPEARQ
ncbi:MAG: ABC transporter substrate-binding protein [Kordiimonadales bacterium]|nr:MAG: ABC transporter substrate-binding protein [Kordiimonadales bacterium]